jgi:hypothetical protein
MIKQLDEFRRIKSAEAGAFGLRCTAAERRDWEKVKELERRGWEKEKEKDRRDWEAEKEKDRRDWEAEKEKERRGWEAEKDLERRGWEKEKEKERRPPAAHPVETRNLALAAGWRVWGPDDPELFNGEVLCPKHRHLSMAAVLKRHARGE